MAQFPKHTPDEEVAQRPLATDEQLQLLVYRLQQVVLSGQAKADAVQAEQATEARLRALYQAGPNWALAADASCFYQIRSK